MIRGEREPGGSLEDVKFTTLEWVWWFNDHRLLGSIWYVPLVEAEETFSRTQEAPTKPLRLTPAGLR